MIHAMLHRGRAVNLWHSRDEILNIAFIIRLADPNTTTTYRNDVMMSRWHHPPTDLLPLHPAELANAPDRILSRRSFTNWSIVVFYLTLTGRAVLNPQSKASPFALRHGDKSSGTKTTHSFTITIWLKLEFVNLIVIHLIFREKIVYCIYFVFESKVNISYYM